MPVVIFKAVAWAIVLAVSVTRHDWILSAAALTLVGVYVEDALRRTGPGLVAQRLDLEPGDALVLRATEALDEATVDWLRAQMLEAFPGRRVAVLGEGLSLEVVSDPAGETPADADSLRPLGP